MKTNPKHLQLLKYVVDNYAGFHPIRAMSGEPKFDILHFEFTDTEYPHIHSLRISHGLFFSTVRVWVDHGPQKSGALDERLEHYKLEISNSDIRSLWPVAAAVCKAAYKDDLAKRKELEFKNLNIAIDKLLNKHKE